MTVLVPNSDHYFNVLIKFKGCSKDNALDRELSFPLLIGMAISIQKYNNNYCVLYNYRKFFGELKNRSITQQYYMYVKINYIISTNKSYMAVNDLSPI